MKASAKPIKVELEPLKVLIEWQSENGLPRSQSVTCSSITESAIFFSCPFSFTLGCFVSITFLPNTDDERQILTIVLNCTPTLSESFEIEVQPFPPTQE
ncbi:MAG: hypothetical protein ACPGUD_03995 [Parashewanella sp.]